MATKSRSSEGCWTCRLRRKKCDEIRPICAACEALEISCLYSDAKPDWMDGAEKQKEKAEDVKAEVKRKAAWRRERKFLHSLETGVEDLSMTNARDGEAAPSSSSEAGAPKHSRERISTLSSASTAHAGSPDTPGNESATLSDTTGNSVWDVSPSQSSSKASSSTPTSSGPTTSAIGAAGSRGSTRHIITGDDERELNFVMIYLDYVFPFLFPFYRPLLLESGRGWLLTLLMRKKTLFHSALSLSSYFFSVVVDYSLEGHDWCRRHNFQELEKQQELALQELQNDVNEVNTRGVGGNLIESTRIMESIIQLFIFEIAVSRTGNWQMHLDGAYVMFEQIMDAHALTAEGGYCWRSVMLGLGPQSGSGSVPRWPDLGDRTPYNSDQAAVRFFTAVLLFADVVSSTALGQPPRLLRFHPVLLEAVPLDMHAAAGLAPGDTGAQIRLEDFVGVQNWTLLLIAQVSELHAWKQEMRRAGSLSMVQLVARATPIETELRAQIEILTLQLEQEEGTGGGAGAGATGPGSSGGASSFPSSLSKPLDFITQFNHGLLIPPATKTAWTTRIWAQAALTYLSVVVSGWQPSNAETRASVAATVALLLRMPAAASLRTAVWPFCITGCLSGPGQEQVFRDLVARMGPLAAFGTVREALGIMEGVWAHRADVDACGEFEGLRMLGTGVPLV